MNNEKQIKITKFGAMFDIAIDAARNPKLFGNEEARADFIIKMLEYGKRLDLHKLEK
tara:strand:- start:1406 stop:1576 length:171 start_codon:yes stop_codon:yes gene_type:complete